MSLGEGALVTAGDPRLWGQPQDSQDARWYRQLYCIRRFEERLLEMFEEGLLRGTTHCCIGQEANALGVVEHLQDGDHIFSHHRGHGHYLAWTGDVFGLLAEIMGKPEGVVGGIGGSQHVCAPGFASNGVLGGTLPAAAGIAWQRQLTGSGISCVFVGDGALGEGVVYETLNIARLWRLPLFVVVEDNAWSQSTPKRINMAGSIAGRFQAFDWPVREIESTDIHEISQVAQQEIQTLRQEGGPRALIINTYRLCHHSKSDDGRPQDEVQARVANEPLRVHGPRVSKEARAAIESEVQQALQENEDRVRAL